MTKRDQLSKKKNVFKPTNLSIKDISSQIPSYLHEPDTRLSLFYLARDVACVALFWTLATKIETFRHTVEVGTSSSALGQLVKWVFWCT